MKCKRIICALSAIAIIASGGTAFPVNVPDFGTDIVTSAYAYKYDKNDKKAVEYYNAVNKKYNEIIKKKVKSGMTDIEKITAVLEEISSARYDADGGSPLLDGYGNCLTSNEEGFMFLQKMGYTARTRFAGDIDKGNGHMNIYLLLNNDVYIVDCTACNSTISLKRVKDYNYMPSSEGRLMLASDNEFVYKLLDDGTVSLHDIIGFTDIKKITGTTWTIPTSVTLNGKKYKVSDAALKGLTTYKFKCTWSDVPFRPADNWTKVKVPKEIKAINENLLGRSDYKTFPKMVYEDKSSTTITHCQISIPHSRTCTEDGYEEYRCECCGEYLGKRITQKATGHSWREYTFEPTTTSEGYTIHTCTNCGESYKDNYTPKLKEEKQAHEHDWFEYPESWGHADDILPTCTTGGTKTIKECLACGERVTIEVPPKGHKYTTKVVAPTTTSEGYTLHTCSVCGDSYKDNYTPKLEPKDDSSSKTDYDPDDDYDEEEGGTHVHAFLDEITKMPTCTQTGLRTYTCPCGYSYTIKLDPLGHRYDSKVVAPTATSQGYTLHTCDRCGHSYKDNFTPKLDTPSTTVSISDTDMKLTANRITYTGRARMPKLTITYNGKQLVKNTDYKVSLKNSKTVGKATIIVRGLGDYTGSKTIDYYVVPKKPVISSVKSLSKKKVTVRWNKNSMADGYQVKIALNANFKPLKKSVIIKKNSTVKTTFSGLTSGKTYYVKVRAYKYIGGLKRFSFYSSMKTIKVK